MLCVVFQWKGRGGVVERSRKGRGEVVGVVETSFFAGFCYCFHISTFFTKIQLFLADFHDFWCFLHIIFKHWLLIVSCIFYMFCIGPTNRFFIDDCRAKCRTETQRCLFWSFLWDSTKLSSKLERSNSEQKQKHNDAFSGLSCEIQQNYCPKIMTWWRGGRTLKGNLDCPKWAFALISFKAICFCFALTQGKANP